MNTFTHRRRRQPCKAVRVGCLVQGHLTLTPCGCQPTLHVLSYRRPEVAPIPPVITRARPNRRPDGSPPVLVVLGGELVVERGRAAVDPVGGDGAAVLPQPAVREVHHGAPLERLQAGGGDQPREGQGLLPELEDPTGT